MRIKVAKGNNTPFSSFRLAIFIVLNGRNSHRWEGMANNVANFLIFSFGYRCPGREITDAKILFIIGSFPGGFIGRRKVLHLYQSRVIHMEEVGSGDMTSNGGCKMELALKVVYLVERWVTPNKLSCFKQVKDVLMKVGEK